MDAETLGTIPPVITPERVSVPACSAESSRITLPSEMIPGMSERKTSAEQRSRAARLNAAVSALRFRARPSLSMAGEAITGRKPLSKRIASSLSSASTTSPVREREPSGSVPADFPSRMPPSAPLRPTASSPRVRKRRTSCLLIFPARTMSTISISAADVWRTPFENTVVIPSFFETDVTSAPPPCTMMKLRSMESASISLARLARLASFSAALPPIFRRTSFPFNLQLRPGRKPGAFIYTEPDVHVLHSLAGGSLDEVVYDGEKHEVPVFDPPPDVAPVRIPTRPASVGPGPSPGRQRVGRRTPHGRSRQPPPKRWGRRALPRLSPPSRVAAVPCGA